MEEQGICIGQTFLVAASNGRDPSRRVHVLGFCRSVQLVSEVRSCRAYILQLPHMSGTSTPQSIRLRLPIDVGQVSVQNDASWLPITNFIQSMQYD